MFTRSMSLVLGLSLCVAAGGCGGGGVEVEGKVVNSGKDYPLAEGEGINVNLSGEGGASASGTVEKDGKFSIKAAGGKSVSAGKYKVSVTHYKAAAGAKQAPAPVTKAYPEEWDVNSNNKSFTLDIAKLK